MYFCKPERNIRQVKLLLFLSAVITALVFLASTLVPSYSALIQLFGFLVLVVAIWLNVRFSLTEYEYAVGNGDFSVIRITGNRRQTVCNIALESATDVIAKRDYDHLPSAERAIIKYSLNQNMFAESYVFLCEFNGKKTMVEFEPNVEFVSILKNEIKLAKRDNENERV